MTRREGSTRSWTTRTSPAGRSVSGTAGDPAGRNRRRPRRPQQRAAVAAQQQDGRSGELRQSRTARVQRRLDAELTTKMRLSLNCQLAPVPSHRIAAARAVPGQRRQGDRHRLQRRRAVSAGAQRQRHDHRRVRRSFSRAAASSRSLTNKQLLYTPFVVMTLTVSDPRFG